MHVVVAVAPVLGLVLMLVLALVLVSVVDIAALVTDNVTEQTYNSLTAAIELYAHMPQRNPRRDSSSKSLDPGIVHI